MDRPFRIRYELIQIKVISVNYGAEEWLKKLLCINVRIKMIEGKRNIDC